MKIELQDVEGSILGVALTAAVPALKQKSPPAAQWVVDLIVAEGHRRTAGSPGPVEVEKPDLFKWQREILKSWLRHLVGMGVRSVKRGNPLAEGHVALAHFALAVYLPFVTKGERKWLYLIRAGLPLAAKLAGGRHGKQGTDSQETT